MEAVIGGILTSFFGALFSLIPIWYTNYLNGTSGSGMAMNSVPTSIERNMNIESVSSSEKSKFYKKWFWRTVILAFAILFLLLFSPLITGYSLKAGYDWIFFIPIFAIETYFITLFYFEELKNKTESTGKKIWFSILALILGAIGVPVVGYITAYIWYNSVKVKISTLSIAKRMKESHFDISQISTITGLTQEEINKT